MSWEHFLYFAIASVLLWAVGAWAAWKDKTGMAYTTTVLGLLVFFSFILSMWVSLERPPLRTMGETRLWYSFFLPLAGVIVYSRWKYKWILSFSAILSLVFICVNLFKPEIHDKTLMPALQSPWFAPHVIVYMFAYAVLGAATVMAAYLLFLPPKLGGDRGLNKGLSDAGSAPQPPRLALPLGMSKNLGGLDNLVYVGLAFLTIGMLFGALWAKEAWGHYWSWDPKETWAAITWLAYLVYVHYRQLPRHREQLAHWMLIVSFILLQMCWWGINYLPSAQGSSVHTYSLSE
jgi:cytochrome c-type biogenesis protein CcsB